MSEINMQEPDSAALLAFLVNRDNRQFKTVTTIRKAVKATRSHGSTVIVRNDPSIIHTPHMTSVWDSYWWSNGQATGMTSHRDVAGRLPSSTVRPGGKLQLQDLHK